MGKTWDAGLEKSDGQSYTAAVTLARASSTTHQKAPLTGIAYIHCFTVKTILSTRFFS